MTGIKKDAARPEQALHAAVATEADMVSLGESLAQQLPEGATLYLHGELGAGKTTLTRGIARGLGHRGAVKSPTYTVVEPYEDLEKPLYHFDLYRLGDPEELEYLGIRDYFDTRALVVVEWPERGGDFLPRPDLEIRLTVDGSGRALQMTSHSLKGRACLAALESGDI
ncbi:tRNA (adenosine(37)-N6)-threonylcarbamoyltransferase complex ATPase subunit type 1 TsaE [Congregibacter sp.]|uniref:tRNA (adenosine(37)-N6)-threonylcarbamoyltransferase complex ATPase subunit type 1 TsaE n=1 Tax=Congregibacter sp. TaxID=2744308 RepID=UPI003F6BB3C2